MIQYQVVFVAWELVAGNMEMVTGRSKWFNSQLEAEESSAFKREGATIVTREVQ